MVNFNWKKVADVSVRNNGDIRWLPSGEFTVTCALDLTYFPFDRQTCYISWSLVQSSSKYIKLRALNQCSYDFEECLQGENGAWDIVEIFGQDKSLDTLIPHDNDTFDNVRFGIRLFRKPLYHFIFAISPIFILSVLGVIQFMVPPNDGEKVTFGSTVMLSCFVFLNTVGDNIPETSETIPLVGTYSFHYF